jgi:hypothetical protein
MKHFILLSFVLFLFKNSFSQNLIQNGSFENYTNPIDCAAGGFDNNGVGIPVPHVLDHWYNYNSPDYFNSTCFGWYNVPNSYFGYCSAKNGNAYVGISVYQGITSEYKEYFYQQLQTPLISGKIYCLSFYLSRADRKEYSIKQIGAYFSNTLPTLTSFSYINAIPQVENQGGIISDTTQWMEIQGCFTANGGEQYITIGNFHTNTNTDTLYTIPNNPIPNDSPYSYYYVDNILLYDQSTVGFNELSNGASIEVYPNPANDIVNFQFSDANTKRKIELYNTIGELVLTEDASTQNSSLKTHHLQSGVYSYNILVGEKTIKTDKIVIIK